MVWKPRKCLLTSFTTAQGPLHSANIVPVNFSSLLTKTVFLPGAEQHKHVAHHAKSRRGPASRVFNIFKSDQKHRHKLGNHHERKTLKKNPPGLQLESAAQVVRAPVLTGESSQCPGRWSALSSCIPGGFLRFFPMEISELVTMLLVRLKNIRNS